MSSGHSTPDEVLAACDRAGMAHEPVTASEVAAELECTRRAALNRLTDLAEQGRIESKKVGARSRVWWRAEDYTSARGRPQDRPDGAIETRPDEKNESSADITKRLETELEEVFGRISEAFYALDTDWQFTYVSNRTEKLIDGRGEDLIGRPIWEVFEWADDSTLGEEFRTAMKTQESTCFEGYLPEPFAAWFEVHAYPSETGLSVYFQDITDRRQRQRKLKASERRYRTLVEHFPNGAVALVDADLRYRTVGGNPLDSTVEELEGKPVSEVLPSEVADELVPRYEAAFEGEASTFDVESNDSIYHIRIVPVRDDDGEVDVALGMSQDITGRKEHQRKLEESERRYRTLAENFPNGAVGLFDEELTYTAAGGQLLDQAGIDPADRIGKSVTEIYPDEILEQVLPYFHATLDGETNSFETQYHDRHLFNYMLPVQTVDGEVETGMLVVQDITDHKEMEQELRESEAKFRTLAESLDEIVWMSDPDTKEFLYVNPAYEDTWGRSRETLYEEPFAFLDGVHPDDRERVREMYEGVAETEFDLEYRIVQPDGEVRWLHGRAGQISTEDGDMDRIVGIAEDVTERVEREQKLEETVEQLEASNERLDSFASMLAHELRNPVTIGQIYSQQLPAEEAPTAVEYITEAFDRMEDMIDVMLVLTRGRDAVSKGTMVRLAETARTAWSEADTASATLTVEIETEIQADETYIRHLFRNLFENAVEHGGNDVTVTVGDLPTGFYVADDGAGIPPDERDAVFESGYTTAGEEGGTGLGLAFVAELAAVYDWTCTITESDAGGACVEFTDVTTLNSRIN